MRTATREERLSDAVMSQVAGDMLGMLAGDRGGLLFRDLRGERQNPDDDDAAAPGPA